MISDAQFAVWLRRKDVEKVILWEIDYKAEVAGAPVTRTLYFSNKPYVSAATDTPANQRYTACVITVPTFTRTLDRAKLGGIFSAAFGTGVIANADGAQDEILGFAYDGSANRVYYGDPSWYKADFRPIFFCVGATISVPDPTTIQFNVKDGSYLLDRNIGGLPVGGTGSNAGKPLPINLGWCHNIECLLVDEATNTYAFSDGTTHGFMVAKRIRGDPLAGGLGDNPAGQFPIAFAPDGTVTVDLLGYVPSWSVGFKTSGIYSVLFHVYGGFGSPTPHSTFVVGSDYDYPLGLSIRDPRNLVDVLNDVANSSNTFFGFDRFGGPTFGRIFPYNPASAPVLELVADDIKPANAIKVEEVIPLYDQIFCSGNTNYTVQTADQLAGITIDQNTRGLYTRAALPYSGPVPTGTSYVDNPRLYHTTMGPSPVIATLISTELDADCLVSLANFAEAYRKKFLSWLQLIDITVGIRAYALELGDIVTLTLDRFALDAGPAMQVTSVALDLNTESVGLTLAYRREASSLPTADSGCFLATLAGDLITLDQSGNIRIVGECAPAAAGVTWNPSDKGLGVVLSNGNLTASVGGGIVRGTTSHSTGKYYFEVLASTVNLGGNAPMVGVAAATVPLTGTLFVANAWAIQSSPAFDYGNASFKASGITFANGDIYQVAVDLAAGKIWFGKNNVWVNGGNPATGANAEWTGVSGSLFPALYTIAASGACVSTAHFAASDFVYAAPSGFLPW